MAQGSRLRAQQGLGLRAGRTEGACGIEGAGARGGIVERTIDEAVQPGDVPGAADRHELNLPLVARLEPHGGASGDVQPHAVGALAVEGQPAVRLEEMAVRPNLHGPIAAVLDREGRRRAPLIDFDLAVGEEVFAWNHFGFYYFALGPHPQRLSRLARSLAAVKATTSA